MKKSQPKKKRRPDKWCMPPVELVFDALDADDPRLPTSEQAYEFIPRSSAADSPYLKMSVWQLRSKALEGDAIALSLLEHQAIDAVAALNSIAKEKPEMLRSRAKTLGTWPVFHSRSPVVAKRNEEFFDEIHLGGAVTTFGIDAAVVLTTDSPQKKWALYLFHLVFSLRNSYPHIRAMMKIGEPIKQFKHYSDDEWLSLHLYQMNDLLMLSAGWWPLPCLKYTLDLVETCVNLPPLADDVSITHQWWSAARELLLLNTDGNPQDVPELYEVGKKAATHSSGLNDDGTFNPNRVRDNIHTKILNELREEFGLIPRALLKAAPKTEEIGKGVALDWIKKLEEETDRIERVMLDANDKATKEIVVLQEQFCSIHNEIAALGNRVKEANTEFVPRETVKRLNELLKQLLSLTDELLRYV